MAKPGSVVSSLVGFLIAAAAVPFAATPAGAARFVVDSTLDAVDADVGDGRCATASGACTLRAAVNEANDAAGSDTIVLPAGTYTLTIPPGISATPPELTAAESRVPRPPERLAPADPKLKAASAVLTGPSPSLTFEFEPRAARIADLFVECREGLYLPMPEPIEPAAGGGQRFRIDLRSVEDAASLKGKTLRLTMAVGSAGAEATWLVR